jgi:citrate lyase beta subunit
MMAFPSQIEPIDTGFISSVEATAHVRAVVEAFAANPGASCNSTAR